MLCRGLPTVYCPTQAPGILSALDDFLLRLGAYLTSFTVHIQFERNERR